MPVKHLVPAVALPALLAALYLADTATWYLWIKTAHLVSVISWMAGLLYLPRLFVYHALEPVGSPASEIFKTMEGRLFRFIMTPAMVATWLFGLWLAWRGFGFSGGWLHAKIAAVAGLTLVHFYLGRAAGNFSRDGDRRSSRHWRIVNEVPTLLMIAAIMLVVVKPF